MKTARGKMKMKSETSDDNDKLSDLPDAILLRIMSLIKIKDAVQTCILSKRWRDLWKSLPNLTLHTSDFTKGSLFSKFVSGIVSYRNSNSPLHSLDFYRDGYFRPEIMRSLMAYAVLNNVEQLKIYVPDNIGLPSCVFSCQSLTSLHISVSSYDFRRRTKIPRSLELPALTSLYLEYFPFSANEDGHAEPFSACKNLKTLSIVRCLVLYPNSQLPDKSASLNINNATLVSLAIEYPQYFMAYKAVISTPNLSSFTINGSPFHTQLGQEGMEVEIQSSSLMQNQSRSALTSLGS